MGYTLNEICSISETSTRGWMKCNDYRGAILIFKWTFVLSLRTAAAAEERQETNNFNLSVLIASHYYESIKIKNVYYQPFLFEGENKTIYTGSVGKWEKKNLSRFFLHLRKIEQRKFIRKSETFDDDSGRMVRTKEKRLLFRNEKFSYNFLLFFSVQVLLKTI